MIAICCVCGKEIECTMEDIEFNDDGFGFVYCPFCEDDNVEITEFIDKEK